MTRPVVRVLSFALVGLFQPCGVVDSAAQTIGTFRWQLAPYCNVVTLTVVQTAAGYSLTGFDDRCGARDRLTVTGSAAVRADGVIALGIATVDDDGIQTVTRATVTGPSYSGTWSGSHGASGTFVFDPPPDPPGEPRPITLRGDYAVMFVATAAVEPSASAVSFPVELAPRPLAPTTNFVPAGGAGTRNCPGTAGDPRAAPGHLCLYEQSAANVTFRCVSAVGGEWTCGEADTTGFVVMIRSRDPGLTWSVGRWAMTPR